VTAPGPGGLLLAIDVGNTNVKLGLFQDAVLRGHWRLTSRREQTADEYAAVTDTLLRAGGFDPGAVKGVALSSTVPAVQRAIEQMARRAFGLAPRTVEPGVNVAVPMRVDYPREVGPDRLVKIVAGLALYRPPLVIIDFGTATTFECVSADGAFVGGAIAPGLATAAEALTSRAARLFRVDLVRPPAAIGRNTVTNIQSGLIYGYAGLVDGLVTRMAAELGGPATVVATGGLVSLVEGLAATIQVVHPHLTLEGLRLWYEGSPAAPPGPAPGA
jgi:type III pantothenate kinase